MSSIQEGLLAISHEPANHPIIKRFLRFAAAVAIVPIVVYIFVSKLARIVTNEKAGLWSPPIVGGLAAVLSLNIVMATFAILALRERVSSHSSAPAQNETREEEADTANQENGFDHAKTE